MKETGLMFKAPLVRAILSGQKTQTRRIVKPAPAADQPLQHITTETGLVYARSMERIYFQNPRRIRWESPVGKPGDRIYVRETWQGPLMSSKEWEDHYFSEADEIPAKFRSPAHCQYAADGGPPPEFMTMDDEIVSRWKPSIHMPKWAARIWLEITGVRVERLQQITDADLEREGIQEYIDKGDDHDGTPRDTFRKLWETTGGDWATNPWVWVIDFKTISTTGRPA
jgi:hypothetical protein